MDGITAFILAMCVCVSVGFATGRLLPLGDVKTECANKGETVIQSTIIKCKPVAAIVDGKRVEFVE